MQVSSERYFMSDEQEKAAMWDKVQEYRQLRTHLAALSDEFKKIAEEWREAAQSFATLYGFNFKTTEDQIEIIKIGSQLTIAAIPRKHLDFDSIAALMRDYQKSEQRRKELENTLGDVISAFTK